VNGFFTIACATLTFINPRDFLTFTNIRDTLTFINTRDALAFANMEYIQVRI
jgi:hypothetical protein